MTMFQLRIRVLHVILTSKNTGSGTDIWGMVVVYYYYLYTIVEDFSVQRIITV